MGSRSPRNPTPSPFPVDSGHSSAYRATLRPFAGAVVADRLGQPCPAPPSSMPNGQSMLPRLFGHFRPFTVRSGRDVYHGPSPWLHVVFLAPAGSARGSRHPRTASTTLPAADCRTGSGHQAGVGCGGGWAVMACARGPLLRIPASLPTGKVAVGVSETTCLRLSHLGARLQQLPLR